MDIEKSTLGDLKNCDFFINYYSRYVSETLWNIRLIPHLSRPRLIEAHEAWLADLKRVQKHESRLKGLNIYKQAGHLAFWIRRTSPVTEAVDGTGNMSVGPAPFTKRQLDFEKLITSYCNEYLAFDFGFQLVKFYRLGKPGGRAENLDLSVRYYKTVCQFMKYKQVSPHALHLIYKSLFFT